MKNITFGFVLLVLSSICLAKPEVKGNPEDLRAFLHPSGQVVTITRTAEERYYSDMAIVSLVVTTEHKRLSDAIGMNSAQRNVIIKQLMGVGIDAEHIKTSRFSTSPQYGWFGDKPSSYKFVNRMAISIFDEGHLKEIASVADANEEIEFSGTLFEHTKKDEVLSKLRNQALEKVLAQKAFYEEALGVKLTPTNFRDADVHYEGTEGAVALNYAVLKADQRGSSKSYSSSKSAVKSPSATSFDEVRYEATVSVDFSID